MNGREPRKQGGRTSIAADPALLVVTGPAGALLARLLRLPHRIGLASTTPQNLSRPFVQGRAARPPVRYSVPSSSGSSPNPAVRRRLSIVSRREGSRIRR